MYVYSDGEQSVLQESPMTLRNESTFLSSQSLCLNLSKSSGRFLNPTLQPRRAPHTDALLEEEQNKKKLTILYTRGRKVWACVLGI